jgi:prephenate dehydrogenase
MAKGQITIVGMDPVGVSLTLAIKRARPDAFIVGVDGDVRRLRDAMKHGRLDRNESNALAGVREASLVILNVPPAQLRETFQEMSTVLREGAVLIALAPVNAAVSSWAAEHLPDGVRYVGGHLVLHPHANELAEPSPEMFDGAVLCLTATAETDEAAIKAGSDLARIIGARPYFMDVHEHDAMIAAVEGMPGIVSAAILMAATRSKAWPELAQIAGAIFAQATYGPGHSAIDGAALVHNRANVLRWLDAFLNELKAVRQAVDSGDAPQLDEWLNQALDQRASWLAARPRAPWSDESALPGPPNELKRFDPLMPGWGHKEPPGKS